MGRCNIPSQYGPLVRQGEVIWAIDLTYFRNSTKVSPFLSSSAKTSRWVSPDIRKVEEAPTPIRRAQLIGSMEYDSGSTDRPQHPDCLGAAFFTNFAVRSGAGRNSLEAGISTTAGLLNISAMLSWRSFLEPTYPAVEAANGMLV